MNARPKQHPTVSIVMASYNKGRYVEAAIKSAIQQGESCELIVVDDASTDCSREVILRSSRGCGRVAPILLSENRGGSHCRNIGIGHARGEFVMFLDADDLLSPDCVASRIRAVQVEPDHDLWVFPMATFVDDPNDTNGLWIPRSGDHLAHFLAHRLDWSIMQPLWRRKMLDDLGGFDETFLRLQDPELHVRALLAGARVRCMSGRAPDCFYRIDRQRHDLDATAFARRLVTGAIHFYRTFYPKVPSRYRKRLTGTLLASLAQLDHWRRSRQIDESGAAGLADELIETCALTRHKLIMRSSVVICHALPDHVPGLQLLTRTLARW